MGEKLNAAELNLRFQDEVRTFGGEHGLSTREQDIIHLLVNGYASSEEIARTLKVSVSTVKNHLHSIFQKSNCRSKAELLASFIASFSGGNRDRSTGGKPLDMVIAEDDNDFRDLLTKAVEDKQCAPSMVEVVDNGSELLDALKKRADGARLPNLILVDLVMPVMDGFTAIEKLRTDNRLTHIPVIAITNSDDEDDVNRAYSIGARSYFVKPQGYHELVDMMATITTYWTDASSLRSH